MHTQQKKYMSVARAAAKREENGERREKKQIYKQITGAPLISRRDEPIKMQKRKIEEKDRTTQKQETRSNRERKKVRE